MQNSFLRLKQSGAPFSTGVLVVLGVSFLLHALKVLDPGSLVLQGVGWQVATYWLVVPASPSGIITLVFAALVLLSGGGQLERDAGTQQTALVFGAGVALTAIGFLIGSAFAPGALLGPWPPIIALLIGWALRRPTARLLVLGLFPVSAGTVALVAPLIAAGSVAGSLPAALGAILGLYGVYFWQSKFSGYRAPSKPQGPSKAQKARDEAYFDRVRQREKDREEREKLAKLFRVETNEPEDEK